ncbi:pilus assembly protein N-terminal domain-containing protein [Methylobacterium nonmethylotrophicum]|uniref:Pilus assembly protein n=1 Tax=Methylobacterium nonmethylotrophicum TaxID=1141884 RepID=A0A4Z0NP49_9HYPH|nr:pilus assembly protein N-terminal domain-containing protein [Methylobacterium nonmethylotrophicum]TGD98599.1 pilus assembly protein [Methylobacterium nonmethylotrophicum]
MSPPRRLSPLRAARLLALALLVPAAAAAQGSDAATVTVSVDNAKVIRLPERTATVIVGNPIIADVSLQRNGIVVLTGKSFGSTNLIALDASGTMLAESAISVRAGNPSVVTVQRGLERESYSCTPACQPAVQLGDAKRYFSEVSEQTGQRNSMATSGGGGGSSPAVMR